MDLFSLEGKTAIVTGASSGIGVQMAHALHDAGATVVLAARRADRIKALADELERSLPLACDVAVDDDLDDLVAATMDNYGRIDIVVNNAGIGEPIAAIDEPVDEFRNTVAVNLTATFALCQKAGRHMLAAGRGSIVNVASILGMVGAGMFASASYASSKGAVIQLTRDLAAQWARQGVRVNALAPGWFETEMTAVMFADEKAMTLVRRKTPMARPGKPGELDGALLFLASDASTFVTGQVLAVDGGWTAI
ncbi:MAG TPA: glucose 1-dehydrogenase [Acidimicrobiales bacterium]|nr:glucose 1-dehydrogenase [Acidimicrobiales bacterium]